MIRVGFRRTDNDIEVKTDMCDRTKPGGGIVSRQAYRVIARVMRGKGEATVGRTTRADDRMTTFYFL